MDIASTQRPVEGRQLDLRFDGFRAAAFDILRRLRRQPSIAQYRIERIAFEAEIKTPFALFRDDIVVNWLVPSGLVLETERNVFSRMLKNDFGAGGCNHHFWLAFYRPGRSRLTDLQLSWSIHPDAFSLSLHAHRRMKAAYKRLTDGILQEMQCFLTVIRALQARPGYTFVWYDKSSRRNQEQGPDDDPQLLAETLQKAAGSSITRSWSAETVVAQKGALIEDVVAELDALRPMYDLMLRLSA